MNVRAGADVAKLVRPALSAEGRGWSRRGRRRPGLRSPERSRGPHDISQTLTVENAVSDSFGLGDGKPSSNRTTKLAERETGSSAKTSDEGRSPSPDSRR